jgi:hypothetical protein
MPLRANESRKIRENPGFRHGVLPPPWPNFLWMFVCMSQNFDFIITSASNHWFQHYATQENPDVLN